MEAEINELNHFQGGLKKKQQIKINYAWIDKVNFCIFLGIVEGYFRNPSTMPENSHLTFINFMKIMVNCVKKSGIIEGFS